MSESSPPPTTVPATPTSAPSASSALVPAGLAPAAQTTEQAVPGDRSRSVSGPMPLAARRCRPMEAEPALSHAAISTLLNELPEWRVEGAFLVRVFTFADYWETIAFVNASAWVSHREDHHPDLGVGYNHCQVRYSTHSVRGLSENDFICAAKLDALFASPEPTR